MPTPQSLLETLKQVKYPGFSRDIVSFGLVKDIQIGSRSVTVELAAISGNADVVAAIRNEVAAVIARETQLPVEVQIDQAPRPVGPAGPALRAPKTTDTGDSPPALTAATRK